MIPAGLAAALLAAAAAYVVESRTHRAEREGEADRTARLLAVTCEDAFFRNDWPAIEKVLRFVGESRPDLLAARIADMAGAVVADWSARPGLWFPPPPPGGAAEGGGRRVAAGKSALLAARPIVSPRTGRRIGFLEILFDEERFLSARRARTAWYAGAFLSVGLFVLLVMRVSVERALAPARRVVEGIRAAAYASGPAPTARTGVAELDELTGVFAEVYEQVRRAQRLAEESARARAMSEMAFGVAHDFNNFLAAIVMNHERIHEALGTHPVPVEVLREAAANIDVAARNAEALIRKIFLLGRHPGEAAERVRFRCDVVVGEAVSVLEGMWRAAAQRRGVRYEVLEESEPVEAFGAAEDIRSTLVNLIVNALDAMPGGGAVTVGVLRDGEQATFFVEDEGPGVPAKIRDRIFEPFFTTKAPHGTGLGLAVARRVAAAHGGRVECLPRRDGRRGARFVLSIPLEAPPAAADTRPRSSSPFPGGRRRVLVVDDDPMVLAAARAMVESLGHSVAACRSAEEALAALSEGDYDTVLSDIGMAPTNGFELARRVKAARPGTFVILMSGWHLDETEDRSAADCFLPKPFRREDVARVLGQPGS